MPPPWGPIHARIHHTLRQRQLLPQGSRVLLAVSGGQDSLALAQLLLHLRRKWRWTLAIAHCDHRWRADSGDNAAHVVQLARGWGLPCYVQTASDAQANAIASEAAARDWRYRQLAQVARKQGYAYLVTGHTASDRAETLLYNLVRGSGADGLQALAWRRALVEAGEIESERAARPPLWLVRPLLEVRRRETAQICATYRLRVWEDETNQDLRYARNRIRHELLPALESFNPGVEHTLAQTAEILQAEVAYLEAQVDLLWGRAVCEAVGEMSVGETAVRASVHDATVNETRASEAAISETAVSKAGRETGPQAIALQRYRLHRPALQLAPLALQRRLLRRLLLQASIAPAFKPIEALVGLIDAPNGSQTAPLHQGTVARVAGEWIAFKTLLADETGRHPAD